jgi:hypothetical protein
VREKPSGEYRLHHASWVSRLFMVFCEEVGTLYLGGCINAALAALHLPDDPRFASSSVGGRSSTAATAAFTPQRHGIAGGGAVTPASAMRTPIMHTPASATPAKKGGWGAKFNKLLRSATRGGTPQQGTPQKTAGRPVRGPGDPPAAESGLALLGIVDRLQTVTSALQELYTLVVVPIVTIDVGGGEGGSGGGGGGAGGGRTTRTMSFGGSPTASRLRVRSFSGAVSPVSPMGGAMGGGSKNDPGEKDGERRGEGGARTDLRCV